MRYLGMVFSLEIERVNPPSRFVPPYATASRLCAWSRATRILICAWPERDARPPTKSPMQTWLGIHRIVTRVDQFVYTATQHLPRKQLEWLTLPEIAPGADIIRTPIARSFRFCSNLRMTANVRRRPCA